LLAQLVQPVLDEEQDVVEVVREPAANQEPKLLFSGYESSQHQEMHLGDEWGQWTERILVVHSPGWAKRRKRGLQGRLRRAKEKLLALTPAPGRGKRQSDHLAPLQAAAEAILQHHRVTGLLLPTYERQVSQRQVRKYKDRPARVEEKVRYQLHLSHDEAAIQEQYRTMGWRLYVTNAPVEPLSFSQAILAYRGAPNIERDFSRLKGRPLGLRPVYLQREDHLKGLVRLLSLGLSILTLTEFMARRALAMAEDELAGLYPGNPKQTTNRPTTERLLAAFKEINLSVVFLPDRTSIHISPLSSPQTQILELLDLPSSIYTNLAVDIRPIPP
jgi:transposase